MSARALKKALKEQESSSAAADTNLPKTDDESESESESPTRPFTNPFDLLNDSDQQQEDDSSDVDTAATTVKTEVNAKKSTATLVTSTSKKSKKKNKKKNKEVASSTDDTNSLDHILEELSIVVNSSANQSQPSEKKSENGKVCKTNILQMDPRFLNGENELRRIFGSKVVGSIEKNNQPGSSRQGRQGRRVSHTHKKSILVSPSDHWPRWDGSLSMELIETKNGCNYFKYVCSPSYKLAQRLFEEAQADHQNGVARIAQVLLHYPYHIESLHTLANSFKVTGELQMSADAIAKSLYAFECAWHPLFNPFEGNCRLKNEHEINKKLFPILFAYMKNMDKRGCHRSALEICKLLISLDSDDPVGALFCIDYFSLRAGEYKWLERFSEEYNSDTSIWLYPNFSYSLAVCRFYLEREENLKETGKATSSDLLKQALMLHPAVLRKLVDKVPLKEHVWSKIISSSFFRTDDTGSASLNHLTSIYVEMSYIVWRLPELHNFLKDTALLVIEKMENSQSEARDWACVRKEAFASNKNEYSKLELSDFSDTISTIPENLRNFMNDPRAAEMHNAAGHNQENRGGVARAPRQVENRNAMAVLLESMLPWVDYGPRENEQENGMARDHED
uniref:transcription factor 25 homolog n=1 Tax=Erigeron canadensis TaxID=72917 RepID=UPI001CB95634|nr:transcription factor 25 homolog [Erigeron canadensis]